MNLSEKKVRLFWFEVGQSSASIILLISLSGLVIVPLDAYSLWRWIVLRISWEWLFEYWYIFVPEVLSFLAHVLLTIVFGYCYIMISRKFKLEQDDHSAPILFIIAVAGIMTFSVFIFADISSIFSTIEHWDSPYYFLYDSVEQITYQIFFLVGRIVLTILWVKVIIGSVGFMKR